MFYTSCSFLCIYIKIKQQIIAFYKSYGFVFVISQINTIQI